MKTNCCTKNNTDEEIKKDRQLKNISKTILYGNKIKF